MKRFLAMAVEFLRVEKPSRSKFLLHGPRSVSVPSQVTKSLVIRWNQGQYRARNGSFGAENRISLTAL